jgi:hypothetical protein
VLTVRRLEGSRAPISAYKHAQRGGTSGARSLQSASSMRRALVLLPFALLTNACAVHQFATGSVAYTSTPPAADDSGALPLAPLVCLGSARQAPTAAIRLGPTCTLTGVYEAHRGRYTSGGEASLRSLDACALPTLSGTLPVRVESTTLQVNGKAVDVTVGGTGTDGRYLTYRFTGLLGENDPSGDCDRILDAAVNR